MEPRVFEQKLLDYGHPGKWCPYCRGYPAYRLGEVVMHALPREVVNEVRLEYSVTNDDNKAEYFLRCRFCEGTGSYNVWELRNQSENNPTPDADKQDQLRREMHAILSSHKAELVRFDPRLTWFWVPMEVQDGAGGS